jgi:protein tyrosine phosphatase
MPLINLIKRAREHQSLNPNSPVVVHCSAGVGRTGAFIVIDYSLEKLKHDKNIDIFNLIKELRAQRPNMVQTVDQYVFCHDAVLEYVLSGNTRVPASDLHNYIQQHSQTDSQTGKTGFENDLQILDKLSPREEMYSYNIGRNDAYAKKIRNASCIPPDGIHVFLSPVPGQGADSTYINAAVIDGYQQSDMYIATQGPLQGTVADFWRLVWEKKILFVVMLTKLEENGEEMSVQYWPSAGTADYAMMSVTLEEEKFLDDYAVRKLLIKNKNDETSDHRSITQFHYLGWPNGQLPKHPVNLLDMIYKLERDQTRAENKSVVVTCSDGIQRCGLFCALSIVIETLKTEQIVDAFQVFRVLRLQNPAFVNGLEEYKFCHDVAQEFLDSFDTYANFKVL